MVLISLVLSFSFLIPSDLKAEPGQGLPPDQIKTRLPELEKLAVKTLQDSGIPGMAIAAREFLSLLPTRKQDLEYGMKKGWVLC